MSKVTAGQSMCHQMIMGAGKTTVVAPTLGLLLADGRRLVMEVLWQVLEVSGVAGVLWELRVMGRPRRFSEGVLREDVDRLID